MRYDTNDGSYVPEDGLYFYNEKDGAIGTRLRIGKQASLLDWGEITDQQKKEIEAQREAQREAEWAAEEATETERYRVEAERLVEEGKT